MSEENGAFDPSASSGIQDDASSRTSSDRARSWHGDIASEVTEDTDISGVSQALGSVNINGNPRVVGSDMIDHGKLEHVSPLENLSSEEKTSLLQEMFPNAKIFDISYTLKKVCFDFGKAVEELLNKAFLAEEGGTELKGKGIDAFAAPAVNARERRAMRKKRQLLRRISSTPGSQAGETSDSPSPLSRWDRAKEDVDFIAQRTYLSPQVIASTYHKSGASLSSTIAALCDSTGFDPTSNPYVSEDHLPTIEDHTAELSVDFPTLSFTKLTALIRLTHPSTGSAHELAHALYSLPSLTSPPNIIPQYLPRIPSPEAASSPKHTASYSPSPLPSSTATAFAAARSTAFEQAQSAYQKSKSKPLMAGAASYYGSVGRDASVSLRRYEAAAADALVAHQSRSGEVDLHGVNVKDAVRISRERAESWWEREGMEWARAGKALGQGLKIITGAGHHSAGGRARLGPAIGKMLVGEGWKIEVGEGMLVVVGRARKG